MPAEHVTDSEKHFAPRLDDLAEGDAAEVLARQGVIVVSKLLDRGWINRLLDAIEVCRADPSEFYAVLSKPGEQRVESDLFRWLDNDTMEELARNSPVARLAARLIGTSEVVFIEDQWFRSEPNAATASPWHQDHPYYNVDRPFVTIWVTLDDVDSQASLRVVPGSHASGELYSPVEFSATSTTIGGASVLPPVPDIEADPQLHGVRSWDLAAGDAVAFDSRTLHATAAKPNSNRPFRRISTRWIHPDAVYVDRGRQAATFWETLPHGLNSGDRLACPIFPLVHV